MTAPPALLSLKEFHRQYDGAKPAYEYWAGFPVQKSTPTLLHGIVQLIIMELLKKAGWNVAPEVRLKVVPDIEPVPDVIAGKGKFKGRYPTAGPELCIEILSPGHRLSKTLEKAALYIQWGSQTVWIIDPENRTAWMLSKADPRPEWIAPGESLRAGDTEIALATLFAEVDKSLED